MNKPLLILLAVLLFLTAVLVSPGWVKDLTEVSEATSEAPPEQKITGKSLDISGAGYYSLRLATVNYAQFY